MTCLGPNQHDNKHHEMIMNLAKPLLSVLKRQAKPRVPPVWLMRQAGRYLPEYQALRKEAGSFMSLALTPDFASEVTLQPIRRFGFDGAILFSDILMVPYCLGQKVWFEEGIGPRLAPALAEDVEWRPDPEVLHDKLNPVYKAVASIAQQLPSETTLLGFCGAPWTVATYMVEGGSSRDYQRCKTLAYQDPERFQNLIDALVEASATYLCKQIEAGAEAVQIFESWGSVLSPYERKRWSVEPIRRITKAVRSACPGVPIIVFPKGVGPALAEYQDLADALGLDTSIDPYWAANNLREDLVLQGNLDPIALLSGPAAIDEALARILDAMAERHFVFNLGHGILPPTPIAHVEHLLTRLRGQ